MTLELQPITFSEACAFVNQYHRHHSAPQGHKFSIGVNDGEKVVGVVIVGRPNARALDNGYTLQITRLCTDGTNNACTKLYGAAWQATKALGYKRLITYTHLDESGASLIAAGWKTLYEIPARSWNWYGRPRVDKHEIVQRRLWEKL